MPEVDSQNNTASWGPLTAANFSADYQVIAWSGAGLVTYSNAEALVALHPTVPLGTAELIYPQDVSLLSRQIAGDNSSMVTNYSSWVPQVVAFHYIARSSIAWSGVSIPSNDCIHIFAGHSHYNCMQIADRDCDCCSMFQGKHM